MFVLGLPYNASESHAKDVLLVPVKERMLAAHHSSKDRRTSGAAYSSLSSFLKTYHFLQFAARAREPLVAIGDDDVFIQPQMLAA